MHPKSSWNHRRASLLISVLLAISVSLGAGTLTMHFTTEFHQEDELNPCDFSTLVNGSGFCYCSPDDPEEAEDLRCGFAKTPSDKEWRAISLLQAVSYIDFISRPYLSIEEFPPAYIFTGMKSLHVFTMKNGAIDRVPSFAFGNSSGVSDINLQDNGIYELSPNSFTGLLNLTSIRLSENNLTEINRGVFVNLPKLKELVLMKNRIQVIHDYALKELDKLEDLALQNNELMVISREVFAGLGRLKHLDLRENRIEYIGDHTFAEMPRLQDLDLHGNQILSVSSAGFAGLKQLTRLNLKDNKIVNLHPKTFASFNKIHFLDLRHNELETLPFSLMEPIYKNLRNMNMQLLVEGNRFMCDCQILWMKALYNETESGYVKTHIASTTCNMFENNGKRHTTANGSGSASPTFIHSSSGSHPNSNSDVLTMLTSPPDETTTYAFESVVQVLNLTGAGLNCDDEVSTKKYDGVDNVDMIGHHDTTYKYHHHHHQLPNPKEAEDEKQHDQENSNAHHHQRDYPSEAGSHNSILNEPQATAALEGTDTIRDFSIPQRTGPSADQKLDASSSITQASSSTFSGASRCCDYHPTSILSIVLALCIAMRLNFNN